jgi:hypothetical protein
MWAAASGKMKVDVYTGASAIATLGGVEALTKVLVGYNSASSPNIDKHFENDIIVTAGNSIYFVLSNLDNQAQDLHVTLGGWS